MAIGNTNSGGKSSSSGNNITITNITEVTFLNDFYPIMLGNVDNFLPGKFDCIRISASSSGTENFAYANYSASINSYYYDQMRWINKCHEDGTSWIEMDKNYAQNPVLKWPTIVKFVDNNGNTRWGWRAVSYTNSTLGDWDENYNKPNYVNLIVSAICYEVNNTSSTISNKAYTSETHFKILTYDTVNNIYVVTPVDYSISGTTSLSARYASGLGYTVTIPYTHILCGISDINCSFNIPDLHPEEV